MNDITAPQQKLKERAELAKRIGAKNPRFTADEVLELVEALEKAQTERDEFRNRLKLERAIIDDAVKYIAELESYSKTAAEFRGAARDENRYLKLEMEIAEKHIAELEESHAQVIQSRDLYKCMSKEGLKQISEKLKATRNPGAQIRVLCGVLVKERWMHGSLPDGQYDLFAAPISCSGKISCGEQKSEEAQHQVTDQTELQGLEDDPLLDDAIRFVLETARPAIFAVQRQFRIGYNRAARIIEAMEAKGVLSSPRADGSRTIIAGGEGER